MTIDLGTGSEHPISVASSRPSPTSSGTPSTPVETPRWLSTAAELVVPELERAISTLYPDIARMVRYHKGWADRDGRSVTGRPHGKGVRPALALWSAQAAGAEPRAGMAAAVAVELVHDFSLLHDDIMDNDLLRRGRPTAWHIYGLGPAVLLGDTLHALAQRILAGEEPHGAVAAGRLAQGVLELCRGQAADLEFERHDRVSVAEYLAMVEGKTGALMRCATTLGALLAGAEDAMIAELHQLGGHLGLLFQIVDDLLGMFGDPEVTGKPVGSDLARRKKTLPILAALASSSAAGRELTDLLRLPVLSERDLSHAVYLVEQTGGRTHAEQECAGQHQQARLVLARLGLPEDADRKLRELLDFLVSRTS